MGIGGQLNAIKTTKKKNNNNKITLSSCHDTSKFVKLIGTFSYTTDGHTTYNIPQYISKTTKNTTVVEYYNKKLPKL